MKRHFIIDLLIYFITNKDRKQQCLITRKLISIESVKTVDRKPQSKQRKTRSLTERFKVQTPDYRGAETITEEQYELFIQNSRMLGHNNKAPVVKLTRT